MEILFFGVILVALMAFVSTKIKKSAAAALEREIIENKGFMLIKPSGFISPINGNSGFAFEAYTKDFGKNDADDFRQARADLIIFLDSSFKAAIENAKKDGEKILSENISEDAAREQKICLLESEKIEKDVNLKGFYKIVESAKQRKIYQLRILVLDAYQKEFANGIDEMLESFTVE